MNKEAETLTMLFNQAKEIERLTAALAKANSQTEEFERKWYLVQDECDTLLNIVRRVHQKMHAYLAIYTGDKELFKILDDCKSAMKETT